MNHRPLSPPNFVKNSRRFVSQGAPQYQRHLSPLVSMSKTMKLAVNFVTSIAGVVDSGDIFATGIHDTGGKFASGINDGGGK
jgi:hypothetical protein